VLELVDRLMRQIDGGEPELEPGSLPPILEALRRWPSPRDSLLALRRLVPGAQAAWPERPVAVQALAAVLSSGPELPRLLVRDPQRMELLEDLSLGREWSRPQMATQLAQRLQGIDPDDEEALALQITAFRNDHYVRLAACEFLSSASPSGLRVPGTLEQVGRELATLADVCLDQAMTWCAAALSRAHGPPLSGGAPCGLAALAMGKYGAQELNFCSDVDLIFIYASDDGVAGELSLHEFFSRVCRRVTRLLSEPNPEGFAFRVDLRLRPEGGSGPICNSLESAERYYETWGGPYDRLAWLKARSAAGDLELGRQMCAVLRPFVFPRTNQPQVVEQIQELYRRVNAELELSGVDGWNVKLGPGGIRQVEFLVQALQLLHAGKQTTLQERASLRALDKLMFLGLITELEHRQLGEAYELWRRIEHRLQLYDGRQTHLLPDTGPLRQRVAQHMGRELDAFDDEIALRRGQVRAIYDTLASAGDPAASDAPMPLSLPRGDGPSIEPLLTASLPRRQRMELLARLGFSQAERAAEQLELLGSRPWGPLGSSAARAMSTQRLARPLLEEIVRSPDPDAALQHVVALTLRHGPYDGLWELLDSNRSTLRLLLSLFGSSDHLARLFIDHPELMDQLLGAGRARSRRTVEAMRRELTARLEPQEGDLEAQLNTLRRFHNEEVLRIGLHDIAQDLELESVWRQLSDVAQTILEQIYPRIVRAVIARYGEPRHADGTPATMAVIGLGKLGGQELTYGSDLDLIFVYSGPGDGRVSNAEFFARLAQRLVGALSATMEEGRLYQVDTRLRPSGNQGTLVVSWPAFREYHARAELWERQVLIKARVVAGDRQLGQELERWLEPYVYLTPTDPALLRQQMHHHRSRMEKELADPNGDFYNLKFGRGGLLDIDFIAQYYQLCHGERHPSLRVRSSLMVLSSLAQEHLMDPQTAGTLIEGYRFLRRIENRLRIVRDRSAERLPTRAQGLEVMARRLGYRQQLDRTPGEGLLADYRDTTESIRGIYEQILAR